jgi:hypothetical protein
MTPEELERTKKLCQQIQLEQDRHKFTQLICELDNLLEGKAHRLEDKPSVPPSPVVGR